MGGATSGGLAVGLIRAVQAIPVSITHKLPGDALAILAAEVIQGARLGGCRGAQGGEGPVRLWLTPPHTSLFTGRIVCFKNTQPI